MLRENSIYFPTMFVSNYLFQLMLTFLEWISQLEVDYARSWDMGISAELELIRLSS